MSKQSEITIGQKVWVLDVHNSLVFRHTRNYDDATKEMKVVGETKKTWLIGYEPGKIPGAYINVEKDGGRVLRGDGREVFFSKQALLDAIWLKENRHKISDAVRECRDVEAMKHIAALLGMAGER
jgi:hypothetical protein